MLDKYYIGEFDVRPCVICCADREWVFPYFMPFLQHLQGGVEEAKQANATAKESAKEGKAQAVQRSSALQGILPLLPVLFVVLAALAAYQFLGK